ncbi:SCO family protein [Fodinibius halophilus]|uniref:SCO family protein n=1 Tax=Fodinibius halophilus TaxID=1736908 RepID=A0A6M1T3Y5_9BACT|nr:SCO family protein [Fodinibius halophilus]NGP88799.1 SCO family protein [Fodinibius halophilus]
MKNVTILTLFVAGSLFFSSCSEEEKKQQDKDTKDNHSAHSNMDMGTSEPSDGSIYHINSRWKNRYGTTINIDSLKGKVQILAMVYTSCEYACPRILADMKRIQDGLPAQVLGQTNFTIVSIDPARDTPGKLKQFAEENDLNNEHWTLLHGNNGNILELAALLGFRYKRISETDFTHSNLITILNKKGEVIYQRKKLVEKPTETIKKVIEAASG